MKPRHDPAPLTSLDYGLWMLVNQRFTSYPVGSGGRTLSHSCALADRRDASIMLVLGWWRVKAFRGRWRFAANAAEFPGLALDDTWWPPRYGARAELT